MKLPTRNLSINNILNNWPSQFDGHLHYCVGLSGGIDSVVLLHLFAQIRLVKPIQLSAIHVNHNISSNAKYWAEFCSKLCQDLNIKFKLSEVSVTKIGGEGLENSARKLRYQEYKKTNADVIVLAHHQDDQIETMLSQIMRGSDLHNCAGMKHTSQKSSLNFWRPLLDMPKKHLLQYSISNNIQHIDDESNKDNKFLRNFIRNKIMPELNNFDNNINKKLIQSLENIQYHVDLTDEIAESDCNNCCNNETLDKIKFTLLSQNRQLNLLAYFIKLHNLPLPSNNRLIEFCRQVNTAKPNKLPNLILGITHKIVLEKSNIKIKAHNI